MVDDVIQRFCWEIRIGHRSSRRGGSILTLVSGRQSIAGPIQLCTAVLGECYGPLHMKANKRFSSAIWILTLHLTRWGVLVPMHTQLAPGVYPIGRYTNVLIVLQSAPINAFSNENMTFKQHRGRESIAGLGRTLELTTISTLVFLTSYQCDRSGPSKIECDGHPLVSGR